MPEQFHFLQPLWLLALLPLAALLWLVRDPGNADNPWRRVVDARLLPWLLTGAEGRNRSLPLVLLATGWLLAVLALADPVWERQPQPVFRSQEARVIVLDLSRSMLAPDLKPSRLARARYKVADLLRVHREGQTALVVFAGDAFTVSPLTTDTATIESLLSPLHPNLMPVQGSRADLGLQKAGQLLQQAGAREGDILLVADGFDGRRTLEVAQRLRTQGYRLSVLGVGTPEGAPLPDGKGGYLRDANGRLIVPKLDVDALKDLAAAGGGRYATIRGDDADIARLLPEPAAGIAASAEQTGLKADVWQSRGPWLVLALLPLAALVFRRGWLLVAVFMLGNSLLIPDTAMAADWNDLWLRRDQQAERALEAGDFEQARKLAAHPLRRGTAAYRAGEYEQALQDFAAAGGADAEYNRGNALAKLGRYRDAIEAYDRALAERPDMQDAAHNRAEVERLLREQQKQQQSQDGQQGDNDQAQQDSSGQKDGEPQQSGESGQSQQAQGDQSPGEPQETPDAQGPQEASRQGKRQQDNASSQANAGSDALAGEDKQDGAAGEADADMTQASQDRGGEAEHQAADAADTGTTEKDIGEQASGKPQTGDGEAGDRQPAQAGARPLDTEEQIAAEQWLRRIPDDPGGLLRRKFLYQYRQRPASPGTNGQQQW